MALDSVNITESGSTSIVTDSVGVDQAHVSKAAYGAAGSLTLMDVKPATNAEQLTQITASGALTETAPASDTASSGLNGRLQRIAQRITSLIALLPTALGGAGGLKVEIVAGAGSGGTALADKAAYVEGTTSHTPVGGVLNETISADPTEDQAAAFRITPKRGQHVNLRNNAGTEIGTSGNPVRTDTVGTTTQPVSIAGTVTVTGTVDTEFPAGAALADATANPTTPLLAALNEVYNGTTWDRMRGDVANGVDVDVTRMAALIASTARIGKVTLRNAADAADIDPLAESTFTSRTPAALTAGGGLKVGNVDALPAGAARIGKITVRNAADAADIDPLAEGTFTARIPAALTAGGGIKVGNVDSLPAGTNAIGKVSADVVAATTAAWVTATADNTAISITVTGYATAILSLNPTGTFTAGILNFEASDDGGTTWFPILGTRVEWPSSETLYALTGATKNVWQFDVAGFTTFRVRLSPQIAGSSTPTANLRLQASAAHADVTMRTTSRMNKGNQLTTITSSTAEGTILTAPGANNYADIYRLVITNTSATACVVTIRDDTAGATRWVFAVPAATTVGFSADVESSAPQTASNKPWTAQCSASVASIVISCGYVKNL